MDGDICLLFYLLFTLRTTSSVWRGGGRLPAVNLTQSDIPPEYLIMSGPYNCFPT
jgi:hypothetical protein